MSPVRVSLILLIGLVCCLMVLGDKGHYGGHKGGHYGGHHGGHYGGHKGGHYGGHKSHKHYKRSLNVTDEEPEPSVPSVPVNYEDAEARIKRADEQPSFPSGASLNYEDAEARVKRADDFRTMHV